MKHYSKQREEVLNILKKSYDHPTAEEVYQKTVNLGLGMSKSTVYRNLNSLTEDGEIRKISVATGSDRYDHVEKEHNHVICNQCGKVYDFEYKCITKQAIESIKKQTNMDSIMGEVILKGICEQCKSKI